MVHCECSMTHVFTLVGDENGVVRRTIPGGRHDNHHHDNHHHADASEAWAADRQHGWSSVIRIRSASGQAQRTVSWEHAAVCAARGGRGKGGSGERVADSEKDHAVNAGPSLVRSL